MLMEPLPLPLPLLPPSMRPPEDEEEDWVMMVLLSLIVLWDVISADGEDEVMSSDDVFGDDKGDQGSGRVCDLALGDLGSWVFWRCADEDASDSWWRVLLRRTVSSGLSGSCT